VAEGTIKKITDKGFGFITTASGKDLFFHRSAVVDTPFEALQEGQRVSFTEGQGPKGPRRRRPPLLSFNADVLAARTCCEHIRVVSGDDERPR
jgi:cold shock protein